MSFSKTLSLRTIWYIICSAVFFAFSLSLSLHAFRSHLSHVCCRRRCRHYRRCPAQCRTIIFLLLKMNFSPFSAVPRIDRNRNVHRLAHASHLAIAHRLNRRTVGTVKVKHASSFPASNIQKCENKTIRWNKIVTKKLSCSTWNVSTFTTKRWNRCIRWAFIRLAVLYEMIHELNETIQEGRTNSCRSNFLEDGIPIRIQKIKKKFTRVESRMPEAFKFDITRFSRLITKIGHVAMAMSSMKMKRKIEFHTRRRH